MSKKKFLSILFICTLLFGNVAFADENPLFETPKVEENAAEQTTETPVQSDATNPQNEATAPVDPAQQTQTPETLEISGKTVRLILGSKKAMVNDEEITLSVPAQSINGRTYLPMRFLAEQVLSSSPKFDAKTKKITVQTGDTKITVTIDSKEAIVNGKKITIEDIPIVKNGTTLLPVKFFATHFGLGINYDAAKKEVSIKEKVLDAHPPVAAFEFVQPTYTQGEKIEIVDKSTDADGDKIVHREFSFANDPSKKNSDINKLFAKAPAGDYEVMYRVRNNKKVWSEWVKQPLTYQLNQPPILSKVSVNKTDIGRGEAFDILYTQENEPWESITETIWSYRHENQDPSKAIQQKPVRFFSSGKYIVTLQLKDAYGNLSEPAEVEINVSDRIVQTQLDFLAKGGGFVNTTLENYNGTNYLQLFQNLGDLTFEDTPGLLIMSDSPENVFDYGILYQEIISPQKGRLLTYHVNKIASPKSAGAGIVVIVENVDSVPVSFSLERTGMKGPSPDPHEVGGKVLETHFLANSQWKTTSIEVGKSAIVYDSRAHLKWKPNNLISMLSEFETTGTVKLTVAAFGPTTKAEHLSLLPFLPRDQHPRGTFPVIERSTSIKVPMREFTSILLGKDDTEWIKGTDGITGETTVNKGNYGIEYKITVTPVEDTLIFVNCRGGAFRGFIGWPDGINRTVSSYGPHDARYLGRIPGGESTTIRYMLANGSASPVQLGFIPRSQWDK